MSRRLRIAHVGKLAPESANGVYVAIAGLVAHLPAEDVEVEIWHLSDRAERISEEEVAGVKVVRLPRHKENVRNAVGLPSRTWRHLEQLARAVDVLHLHSVYQGHNVAVSRLPVPYVVSPHSGYTERVTRGRNRIPKAVWRSLWENDFVRRAASLHAVSGGETRELQGQGLAKKVAYIPNGLDDRWLHGSSGPAPAAGPWVFLGRLAVEQKGLDLLLDGYARARRSVDLPDLQLVGPDFRGSVSRLRQMVSDLGLSGCVDVLPPVFGDEKLSVLRRAGAVLHPSRWDGMPFTVLEAMALARPVLVTPSTNLAEEVRRFGAGVVVSESADGVAEGLSFLAASAPEWRQQAGLRGADLVHQEFTWAAAARSMAELYRKVAA